MLDEAAAVEWYGSETGWRRVTAVRLRILCRCNVELQGNPEKLNMRVVAEDGEYLPVGLRHLVGDHGLVVSLGD